MLYMVKKELYTFRLPADLIKQIDRLTEDRTKFVALALEDALRSNLRPILDIDEKKESHEIDYDDEYLNRYIDRLETDLEFWKDKYEVLQLEYYDQVRDSIKRLDSKFERVMHSIDESKHEPLFEPVSLNPKVIDPGKGENKSVFDVLKKKSQDYSDLGSYQDEIDELIQALKEREKDEEDHKFFKDKKDENKKKGDSQL